jgi:hypothetical protein
MLTKGAIQIGGGRFLRNECEKLGGCKPGETKMTKGYRLVLKSLNSKDYLQNLCYTP